MASLVYSMTVGGLFTARAAGQGKDVILCDLSWHDSTAGLQLCKVWVLPGGEGRCAKGCAQRHPKGWALCCRIHLQGLAGAGREGKVQHCLFLEFNIVYFH